MNILPKIGNLIRPSLSESTVQAKENCTPRSQTAENVSAWVCTIFKQQKPLQVHSLWSLRMVCCPAGKKWIFLERVEYLPGLSEQGWRNLGIKGQRAASCFPCDTETNQAGDELCLDPSRKPAWQPSLPLLYSRINLMHGLNNQV